MKLKTVASIITFSIIATTMIHASTTKNITESETITNNATTVKTSYTSMSTEELQIEVEKHSHKDCLPFELGKEMIKRWTKG